MFDRVVCLSLDKRHNEQKRVKGEAKEVGLDVDFFLVGDGLAFSANEYGHIDIDPPRRSGYPSWVKRPNSYNAFLSFRKIIAAAKKDKVKSLLLLEDDVTFLPNFAEVFPKAKEQLDPNWEMFYLGANHTFRPTIEVSPNILQLNGSGCWHAVALRYTIFDAILSLPILGPIDGMVGDYLHPKHLCYACWPNVAWVIPGFSHCEGIEVSYAHYKDNKGC